MVGRPAVAPMSRSQMTALVMMRNGLVLTDSSYRAATGIRDSRIATREPGIRGRTPRGERRAHSRCSGEGPEVPVGSGTGHRADKKTRFSTP